ncbi:MAG: flagellar basal body L-ring protein FlgH [Acidobacteria bacterium]|nr:flagellar basal body L-ring protein FlgH [Acidobacteriota bacterium]
MAADLVVCRRRHGAVSVALCAAAVLIGAGQAGAQQSTDYDDVYFRFLNSARKTPPAASTWMGDLTSDRRAQQINDLVTVRVLESLTATGAADSTVAKGSDASVGLPSPASKAFSKILPTSSSTKFNGAGGTTRTTELTAALTARVTEVLPSGDLVIEGIREVDINGDRNLVVLTGVIRTADIQPGNVVLSTHIGQLRIRSLSQGLIHDSLEPGWLIRILNRIF